IARSVYTTEYSSSPSGSILGSKLGTFVSWLLWGSTGLRPSMLHFGRPVWTTTRALFVPPALSFTKKGWASVYYVILTLAAILMGTAVGALLGPRNKVLFLGSLITIALCIVTFVTGAWLPLAIGAAVSVVMHSMQRETAVTRA
ncbi:MAG TPA: hypothetical protein VNQ97_14255, partial [Burkholderiaceae bacterium]|nr:hypothetical protein [Burkholderiaceae bacterium]